MNEDNQIEFKNSAKLFVPTYDFLGIILRKSGAGKTIYIHKFIIT